MEVPTYETRVPDVSGKPRKDVFVAAAEARKTGFWEADPGVPGKPRGIFRGMESWMGGLAGNEGSRGESIGIYGPSDIVVRGKNLDETTEAVRRRRGK